MPTQTSRIHPTCLATTVAAGTQIRLISSATVGYIAGSVFSIINPIGGAIFGATYSLSSLVTEEILGILGCNNNTALRIANLVISGVLGAVAAIFTVAAVGFPITFTAAAILVGGMVLVKIAIRSICFCCICSTDFLLGIGTAITDTRENRPAQ